MDGGYGRHPNIYQLALGFNGKLAILRTMVVSDIHASQDFNSRNKLNSGI